ncbi:MAG: c-type cytochrome, partial [Hyphomicrobiaceae bacterium]
MATGRSVLRGGVLAAAMSISAATAVAQTAPEQEGPRDPPPPLPAEMLKDAKVISQGEKLWQDQCTHCHGARSYPGKAPKLQPRLYKPEFVWDRTHNGFRAMPPWKDVYKPEEIVALVAYVLS